MDLQSNALIYTHKDKVYKWSGDEAQATIDAMQRYGGSFTYNLGRALHYADSKNKLIGFQAWHELVVSYRDRFVRNNNE